ncbi:MAG: hypothetical protein AUJ96_07320 [Armatimonadetes bacterium CG2_30_66_41]|nr:MAG: hypothetical protein AUJ96_07320 [Armatimonadetes bacterium CG2_30_66_41]
MRLHGTDLLAELQRQGIDTPIPSQEAARSMAASMEKILDETEQRGFPERICKLPADPRLATRKLARWFMIREGAHLLIAEGAFPSFRQSDVLDQLKATYPQWRALFVLTERILDDPFRAGVPPDEFLGRAAPSLRWAIRRIACG